MDQPGRNLVTPIIHQRSEHGIAPGARRRRTVVPSLALGRRRHVLPTAVALLLALAVLVAPASSKRVSGANSDDYTALAVVADDDAYVSTEQPDANFNSAELELTNGTLGLLKFTVTGAPEPVTTVKVKLLSRLAGGGLNVYAVSPNGWNEEDVTWNTRPALGDVLTRVQNVEDKTVRIELPREYVTGDGTYAIALEASGSDLRFATKETRRGSDKPELIVSDHNGRGPVGATVITVDADMEKGTVSPGLFSNNHRYANGGFGLLDLETQTIKPELVEAGRDLGVTGLRFPGGTVAETYDWRDGIGPVDERPRGYEYGTVEHMQYVEALGPEAVAWTSLTLGRGRDELTVDEAAGYVEFMNGPNDGSNPNGGTDWAQVRANLGHPEPYGIRYWVLGTELRSDLEAWLDGGDPEGWVGLPAIRDAMKEVDPTVKVGIGWELGYDKLFEGLAERGLIFDFVDVHGLFASDTGEYSIEQDHYLGVHAASRIADYYLQAKAEIARYLDGEMDVISLENDAGSNALKRALHHTLANSVSLMKLIEHGVEFQSHSPYTSGPVNPFAAPIRTTHIEFDNQFENWYFTAPSYAYKLFADRVGENVVETAISGNPVSRVGGSNTLPIRDLYTVAATDDTGETLDLVVANVDASEHRKVKIDLRGFRPQRSAEVYELNGANITTENTLSDPNEVGISVKEITGARTRFKYTLPAHSVTAIRFVRAENRRKSPPRPKCRSAREGYEPRGRHDRRDREDARRGRGDRHPCRKSHS